MSLASALHRSRVLILALAFPGILALVACGRADEDSVRATTAPGSETPASTPTATPAAADQDVSRSDGVRMRITFGDAVITAKLDDTATARDLAAQLPLTLSFRDHNGVEKTAPLPRKLSLDGASQEHDPAAGDLGYWAPDGDLVLYYADAPAFQGIVRIGEIDGGIEALGRQSGDFRATVARTP